MCKAMPRILIRARSSCVVMHTCLFMELRLHKENLSPYENMDLQVFIDSLTYPCGTMELLVSFSEGEEKKKVDMCFVVILYKSIYNFILEKSIFVEFDVVALTIHLNIKYHSDMANRLRNHSLS